MKRCRIINGGFKHRFIKAPETSLTRPTSDIVKQSLFNVLIHRFQIDFSKFCVIDCFAGSGSLGIEAISLGCKLSLFIDSNLIAIKCLNENIKSLGIENIAKIKFSKIESISDKYFVNFSQDFENILIFLDPPYKEKTLLIAQLNRFKTIFSKKHYLIVVETDEDILDETAHKIQFGNTVVNFIKNFE